MSQMERVFFINRRISNYGKVTVKEISLKFEISTRQAKRDIEYMRDRLTAPLEYSYVKKGYFYTTPFDRLSFADEKTLLFYTFIEKISANEHYLPFVSKEVLASIHNNLSSEFRPFTGKISYELEEWEKFDLSIFQTLISSFMEKKLVEFSYHDARGKSTRRQTEPLHLMNYAGHWYLIAYDENKREIRKFHFSRIAEMRLTEKTYMNPVSESRLKDYLSGGFGIYKDEKSVKAVIRFYEPVIHIVRDQTWHPLQKLKNVQDDAGRKALEMTLPVSAYDEILGKILRYADAAEAVAPDEFRNLWKQKIQKMAEKYL